MSDKREEVRALNERVRKWADSPADIIATLERDLAAARAECEEQARLNGMRAEREARLMAERDEALRKAAKDGWRQCAAGQGTTQFCAQAEVLAEALRSVLSDFVYEACGRFADDAPGTRAECADKIKRKQPCKQCPERWKAARAALGQREER